MPVTRKRYIDAEIAAQSTKRPAAITKEAIRRWSRWSAQDKNRYIQLLDAITAHREARDDALQQAHEADRMATNIREYGLPDRDINGKAAATSWREVASDQQDIVDGRANLITFYTDHGCSTEITSDEEGRRQGALARLDLYRSKERQWLDRNSPSPRQSKKRRDSNGGFDQTMHSKARKLLTRQGKARDPFTVAKLFPIELGSVWRGPFVLFINHDDTMVTAYVQTDAAGIIQDTVVRKDVMMHDQWTDTRYWEGNVRDIKTRQPYENACHKLVTQASSADPWSNFLGIRHEGGVNDILRMRVMYTELAAYGTLEDVLIAHRGGLHIPEPFLWYILMVLVDCGLVMQFGSTSGELQPGWKEIVHWDIKPGNVFLCAPNPAQFPQYPAPKLGDFGHSCITTEDDPANPDLLVDYKGTEGYMPPEQSLWIDALLQKPIHRFKVGAHTNVFAVGLTIRNLILDEKLNNKSFEDGSLDSINWPLHARTHYTTDLLETVESCLKLMPERRATFTQLKADIQDLLKSDKPTIRAIRDVRTLLDGRADQSLWNEHTIFNDNSNNVDQNTLHRLLSKPRTYHAGDLRFQKGSNFNGDHIDASRLLRPGVTPADVHTIGRIGYETSWRPQPREVRNYDDLP